MPHDQTSHDDSPSGSDERRLIDAARAAAQGGSSEHAGPPLRALPVDRFPGYQVVREIHRGGQGVVYQGVQLSTGRKVAIKVMHAGPFATASDRKRFEREVDILVQLSHPNIVDVIDSGEADGSFFYVMEYISGSTLDRFLDEHELSQTAVLELAAKICDAVNAAHLRGVIHRDLKPANIRVDASGEPHIVDFGLAKVAGGSTGAGQAMQTMTGQFLGSLPWASPEQAEGAPDKIDVRTDVYSLGVVLYQLLTGAFPYEVVGTMRDVLDNILKAEPARPSTIRRKINNEIETIVLKCLSKERERRYQNAGEISRDLRHYLRGEPIEAKRDSSWYVLTKMARRHRAAVVTGATGLVLVVVFAGAMWMLWRDASASRDRAEHEQQRAVQAEQTARLEAARATSVQRFLQRILAEAKPDRHPGHPMTVVEFLDDARERIDQDLTEEPLVEAIVRFTIGQSYFALTRYTRAADQFRAAIKLYTRELGVDDEHTIDAMHELALALRNMARYDEAEALYRAVVDSYTASRGPDDRDRLIAMVNLARTLEPQGRLAEAIALYEQAVPRLEATLGADAPATRQAQVHLAGARAKLDDRASKMQAVTALRDQLATFERDRPTPDRITALLRVKLAVALRDLDELAEAEQLLRTSVDELEAIHPDGLNSDLIGTRSHLAQVVLARGDAERAEPIFRQVVEATKQQEAPDAARLAFYRGNLGVCLMRLGRLDEAETELRAGVEGLIDRFGIEHTITQQQIKRLVELYERMGKTDDERRYRAMIKTSSE